MKKSDKMKKRYHRLKKEGKCVQCGVIMDRIGAYCSVCRAASTANYRFRSKKGK